MWTVKLYSQSWGEPAVLTGGRTRTHTKRRDGHTDRTYLKLIAFLLAYLQPYMATVDVPVRCSLLACRAHLRRQVKSNLTSKWTAGARTHCVTDSLPSTTTPAPDAPPDARDPRPGGRLECPAANVYPRASSQVKSTRLDSSSSQSLRDSRYPADTRPPPAPLRIAKYSKFAVQPQSADFV